MEVNEEQNMAYATLNFYPNKDPKMRFFALWYFCTLLILWTILGDTVLGFEQSYAQPIVAVLTACVVAFLLEWLDAKVNNRTPRFAGSWRNAVNFLPPCIIPGLACAMLIYPNERLSPIVFAAAMSLASKVLIRAPIGNGQTQHVFNPSNAQALIRSMIFHTPLAVPFLPMTSAGFILFALYMIPDPATTPIKPLRQVLFGLSVATLYALLFVAHVVYGLFLALALTSATRGISLWVNAQLKRKPAPQPVMRVRERPQVAIAGD
ncbi:MAG: enediyne biosynthesis protein UnbU [Candidatus Angelobacter sp. Gp1-AA117]|nr:MAG: enediyne biosynthesis protein UnbU [Candidatus Angelobacter sp. Gp1-AA117]